MKVIISKPGIKIEDINKDSFYAVTNNNKTPIGGRSLWNGMMLIENIIYTCSSGNNILFSEIPLYANTSEYGIKLKNEYYIINGNAEFNGNKIIIQKNNTLVINRNIDISINDTFYSYVTPNVSGDCGLIFGLNDYDLNNNKEISYYSFLIKENGYLSLEKYIKGIKIKTLIKEIYIKDFNKNNEYKMIIKYNLFSGEILASISDLIQLKAYDKEIKGNRIGFISDGKGAIFTNYITNLNLL